MYTIYKKIRAILSPNEIRDFLMYFLMCDYKLSLVDVYEEKLQQEG